MKFIVILHPVVKFYQNNKEALKSVIIINFSPLRIKQIISENIYGILGTIGFHLILGIVFLSIKISTAKKHIEQHKILIDFQKEIPDIEKLAKEKREKELDIKATSALEREMKKNIGVNVADDFKKDISTEKYLEELSENYKIESYGKGPVEESYGDISLPDKGKQQKEKNKSRYKGPTNIYYDLNNRYDKHLPVPVYLCTGSGKIVVDIKVDRDGNVTSANINHDKSNTYDPCLFKAAREAALSTIFNTRFEAPLRQEGTITYQFVAQETLK